MTTVVETPITGKYRFQQPLLFQRAHAEKVDLTYVNSLDETINVPTAFMYFDGYHAGVENGSGSHAFGSTPDVLCTGSKYKWTNTGGDWIDKNSVKQGNTPFISLTLTNGTPAGSQTLDVSDLVQECDALGRWYAFVIRVISGSGVLSFVNAVHPTLDKSELQIVRGGAPETRALWYAGTLRTSTSQTDATYPLIAISANNKAVVEFFRPEDQSVQADTASLVLKHNGVAGGSITLGIFRCDPFIPDMNAPVAGIAADYTLDEGLFDHPDVAAGLWVRDDTVIEDVLDTMWTGTADQPWVTGATVKTSFAEAFFDPTLWGEPGVDAHMTTVAMPNPAQMAELLPHRNVTDKNTRMVGTAFKSETWGDTLKVMTSAELEAAGLPVLAPGLGAIRFRYHGCGIETGQTTNAGTTTGSNPRRGGTGANDLFVWFKRNHIGRVTHAFFRMYFMLGDGWDCKDTDMRWYYTVASAASGQPNTMGFYPEQVTPPLDPQAPKPQGGSPWRPTDRSGKFPGGVQQRTAGAFPRMGYLYPTRMNGNLIDETPLLLFGGGGYSNSSGVYGYQGRFAFILGHYKEGHPGPCTAGMLLYMEHYDFGQMSAQTGHQIPSQQYIKGWDGKWQAGPHLGGLGFFYPKRWYALDYEWRMNDVEIPAAEAPIGTHYLEPPPAYINGYENWWVDGVPAGTSPVWGHRTSRILDWLLQTSPAISASYRIPFDSSQNDSISVLRPITNVPLDLYMGAAHAILQTYYGGQSANPRDKDVYINAMVVSNGSYIGPMRGVSRENGGLPSSLQLTGNVWTPNRNSANDEVLDSDYALLPANVWLTVAGTNNKLRDVAQTPTYAKQSGSDGTPGIINAWSGAGWDDAREAMLINGGGHSDTSGADVGVFEASSLTMRFTRIVDRQALATTLQRAAPGSGGQSEWTNLVAGDPFMGGMNFPLSTGYAGSNHSAGMIEWLPPSVMGAIGFAAPLKGGLFVGGMCTSIINLDTGACSQLHYTVGPYPSGNVTLGYESSLLHFMRDIDSQKLLGVRNGSWYVWDAAQTEMTLWQSCSQCASPATPSRGKYLPAKSNGAVSFSITWAMVAKLRERREIVCFYADYTAKRVRYGQGVDAAASDLASYTDTITLTSDNGSDHLHFSAANYKGYYGHNLNHAGAFYDHMDGCIWVCSNDSHQGTYNSSGDTFTPGTTVPMGVYKITGATTGSLADSTWKVKRIPGTESLVSSQNGTWGRFVVVHRGAQRIGMRVSGVDNPIEVIRLVP